RGVELGDFIFDAAIQEVDRRIALEVLSFGSPRKDWTPVLHDAGHFLYGIREVHAPGLAVVQPPIDDSDKKASRFFERVEKWFAKEGVPTLSPEEVSDAQISVCLSEPAAALKSGCYTRQRLHSHVGAPLFCPCAGANLGGAGIREHL